METDRRRNAISLMESQIHKSVIQSFSFLLCFKIVFRERVSNPGQLAHPVSIDIGIGGCVGGKIEIVTYRHVIRNDINVSWETFLAVSEKQEFRDFMQTMRKTESVSNREISWWLQSDPLFASENRRYFISFGGKYARRQNESYIWYIKTSVFPFFYYMPLHIFIRVSPFFFPPFSSSFFFFFFFRYSAFEICSHETRHSFNHSRIMSMCFLPRKRTDFFRSRFEYRTRWKP